MRRIDVVALAVGAFVAAAPGTALAAGTASCEASGPHGTVLGQRLGAPPVTEAAEGGCAARAAADGVRVRSAPDTPVALPIDQVANRVGRLSVPLPGGVAEALGPIPPLVVGGDDGIGGAVDGIGGAVDEVVGGVDGVVGGVLDGIVGGGTGGTGGTGTGSGSGSGSGGTGGGLLGNLPIGDLPIVGDLPILGSSGSGGSGGGLLGGLLGARRATTRQAPSPTLTVDLRPALAAALPEGRLPSTELAAVDGVSVSADVRCVDGRALPEASVDVAQLRVLGAAVPVGALDRSERLTAPLVVDPSGLDLGLIRLPAGISLSDPVVGPLLTTALRTALDALPTIELPATVARVVVTPGAVDRAGGAAVARGPRVQVTIAGQPLADVTLGEATARAAAGACGADVPGGAGAGAGGAAGAGGQRPGGVDGAAASGSAPGAAGSRCARSGVAIVDVRRRGSRLRVAGVAPVALAGRRVVVRAKGRRLARTRLRADGSFAVRTRRLPRAVRRARRAPLRAAIGARRSKAVELHARARLLRVRRSGRRVVLVGRVAASRGRTRVVVLRQVGCASRAGAVKRVRARRDGRFRVRVRVPRGADVATFRVRARVRQAGPRSRTARVPSLPRTVRMR